jgi:hypothetical protein
MPTRRPTVNFFIMGSPGDPTQNESPGSLACGRERFALGRRWSKQSWPMIQS